MKPRFIRLNWSSEDTMSTQLQSRLKPKERVVSISATRDEILVVVEESDE